MVAEQAIETARARAARPGHRPPANGNFNGLRVLTLESRRAPELALLVVNYGGQPIVAPALREVSLDIASGARALAAGLVHGEHDIVILTTGIGTRLFLKAACELYGDTAIIDALNATRTVSRGPKPTAALREVGLTPWLTAATPNTWREVIAALDSRGPALCRGASVAVQEYGAANPELAAALHERGAHVASVPLYRWELPENLEPLQAAVRHIVGGTLDVVLLTASVQLVHLLDVAAQMHLEHELRDGLARVLVASIGPMTSDEARRQCVRVDLEPSHPKMGFLVKETAEQCHALRGALRMGQ